MCVSLTRALLAWKPFHGARDLLKLTSEASLPAFPSMATPAPPRLSSLEGLAGVPLPCV